MRTDRAKLSALAALVGAVACMCTLVACGSSGGEATKTISVSAVAKCTHASPEPTSSIPSDSASLRAVVAKTIKGGWLHQNTELTASDQAELQAQEQTPQFDLYVFPSAKTATEAFKLISSAPNASAEYGAGGTFQRGNVIVSTEQEPPGSLTALAESLLNKCAGAGATESVLRSQESTSTGQSTTGESSASQEGAPGEQEPSQGQSPVPGEG
jgi:hypothetical protein